MELAVRWGKECVWFTALYCILRRIPLVTDMLVAVLNTCSKEELEEAEEENMTLSSHAEETFERRKIIKNKILAVGRMARVFALLRSVLLVSSLCICY